MGNQSVMEEHQIIATVIIDLFLDIKSFRFYKW